jgi:hypothetical protein
MKKLLGLFLIAGTIASTNVNAQVPKKQKMETEDSKAKVKPETTVGDKAHNVIHPHNKRSHGTKYKVKTPGGKVTQKVTKNSVKTEVKND